MRRKQRMHLDITAHVPFRKCRGMNNTFENTKYVGLYLFHKKIFFKNQKDYGKKKKMAISILLI